MGPASKDKVLIREGRTQRHRKKPRERGEQTGGLWPQANDIWRPPGAESLREAPPRSLQREQGPARRVWTLASRPERELNLTR